MNIDISTKERLSNEILELHKELNRLKKSQVQHLQYQQILRQSQKEYETLVEHLPVIVARVNLQSQHIYINPIIHRDTGISPQDFIGKTFREVGLPNNFCLLWESTFSYVFSTGKEVIFESDFINQLGNHCCYQCRVVPEFNQEERIQSALYTLMNITDHKHLEAKLYQQHQEFQALIENTPDIISRIDETMHIAFINPAVTKLTGKSPQEFFNKTLREVCDINFVDFWEKNVEKVFTTKQPNVFEYEYPGIQGTCHFHARIEPEFRTDGSVEYALCTSRDITTHKHMATEMARLDRLNLVGEMAASIGHEVRNPMTTVRGFLQMMLLKTEYKKHTEFFHIMIEELDRANSILSEFLSLAKDKSVQLNELNINTIVTTLMPLMQANGIVDNKYIHSELAPIPNLLLDEKEIRQLILNLVNNGLDAMDPGRNIYIKTFTYDNTVVLAVQDEGHGITAKVMKKIGTPFFTTKENGTGLGLAVCYSIANRHNATIQPITGPRGTTFYVLFQIHQ
jgi:PAS domain S-box-containing protein